MTALKGVTLTLKMGPVAVKPVPETVAAAFESVDIALSATERSGFQLNFVFSKTSTIATDLLPSGFFDPMNRVMLIATLNGVSRVLADGPIKRHDVSATTTPGENRLTVSGEDILGYLDAVDFTGIPFPALPPFARVGMLLAKYPMFGVIPMVIPSVSAALFSPTEKIPAQQGTDYEYIDALAREAGYVFHATPGPNPGMNTVYWGPQVRTGTPQPALSVDFDQASNIDQMSFSVNGDAMQISYGFIKIANFPVPVPELPVGLLKPPLAKRPIVPTRIRLMETERLSALDAAGRILSGSGNGDPVTASGSTNLARYGQPINPGTLIGVRGAGAAYDGNWYVSNVSHSLSRGSWQQSFQLAREGLISQKNKVAV